MAAVLDDVLEAGRALGLDEAAVAVVVRRAGSEQEALRRLRERQRRIGQQVLRDHERRLVSEEAERRRTRHEKRREAARQERLEARAAMPLAERLAACLSSANCLPGLSSASFVGGGVSSGSAESEAPPDAENELLTFYLPRLLALVIAFERDLDVEMFGAEGNRESVSERDRRVAFMFEGWSCAEVVAFDRSVSSVDTVARARVKHGRDAKRGRRVSAP